MQNKVRRIVIDTREQRPYSFPDSIREALPAGDYSLEGLQNQVAVERKSMDDFVNTILHSKRRFRAELTKLQSYSFAAVVIEGSVRDILAGEYHSDVNPQALLGITVGLMQSFPPVAFIFAHDRPHAYAVVAEILKLAEVKYGSSV